MNCGICEQIDPALSNVKNAEQIGVGESTIRRHKKHMSDEVILSDVDEFFDIPNAYITRRGKTIRLPDGSYEKIEWKPNAAALHKMLDYDDLEDILSADIEIPEQWEPWRDHTEVFDFADAQIGKADQRGGGTPETLATLDAAIGEFVAKIAISQPETVLLADGGDLIENIFNVKSQKYTNDIKDPVTQGRVARRQIAKMIKAVAPYAPEIILLSVPSNHGAVRDGEGRDSQAGTVDADFGLDINYQLEEQFADREAYSHVRFVRPDPLEETAVIDVSGTRIAFHHGHQSGGIHKHSEWWAKQSHGRRPGWDADIFVLHHWHTPNLGQSGNGRWIISATASEPGSDWYTNKTGESSVKGCTSFAVKDGKWFDYRICGMRAPA